MGWVFVRGNNSEIRKGELVDNGAMNSKSDSQKSLHMLILRGWP